MNKTIELLKKQLLIALTMEDKVQMLARIRTGYKNDVAPFNIYQFFGLVAIQYYRSIVIDLCALFVKSGSHKVSFHKLLSSPSKENLSNEVCDKIEKLLSNNSDSIFKMQTLRDSQFAHYDFKNGATISFDYELYEDVKKLKDCTWEIIHEGFNHFNLDYLGPEVADAMPFSHYAALEEVLHALKNKTVIN